MFDNPGRARAALDELKAQRFDSAEMVAGPEGRGQTLLRVEAPFGTAIRVEEILDRHANAGTPAPAAAAAKPAVTTAPPQAAQPPSRLPAAKTEPAKSPSAKLPSAEPRSAEPGAPARNVADGGGNSRPRTLSQILGIPELIDSDTFFSGFPLLIRPAPKRAKAEEPVAKQPVAKPN
ncbi:hypothetical protein [Rhodopseudomonas pseudopalustris]|uniref:hypothetical protein n=1 Tax=Rhodopseudomonas pseudopalustris TaxID=1513892 RepID=UPI00158809A2|nr:hypothetical protein [Rhodopseudomonas pseudopalustris]